MVAAARADRALARAPGLTGDPARPQRSVMADFAAVARAARSGAANARALLERSARCLAVASRTLTNIMDLNLLVLTGPSLAIAGSVYLPVVREEWERTFFARDAHPVEVRLSPSAATVPRWRGRAGAAVGTGTAASGPPPPAGPGRLGARASRRPGGARNGRQSPLPAPSVTRSWSRPRAARRGGAPVPSAAAAASRAAPCRQGSPVRHPASPDRRIPASGSHPEAARWARGRRAGGPLRRPSGSARHDHQP